MMVATAVFFIQYKHYILAECAEPNTRDEKLSVLNEILNKSRKRGRTRLVKPYSREPTFPVVVSRSRDRILNCVRKQFVNYILN
jgi:hypothetical protein